MILEGYACVVCHNPVLGPPLRNLMSVIQMHRRLLKAGRTEDYWRLVDKGGHLSHGMSESLLPMAELRPGPDGDRI